MCRAACQYTKMNVIRCQNPLVPAKVSAIPGHQYKWPANWHGTRPTLVCSRPLQLHTFNLDLPIDFLPSRHKPYLSNLWCTLARLMKAYELSRALEPACGGREMCPHILTLAQPYPIKVGIIVVGDIDWWGHENMGAKLLCISGCHCCYYY